MELSELLNEIDAAALDGDVTRALLLCQKLAGHAGSEELRSWAERELTGYPPDVPVPELRRVSVAMYGHGVIPGARVHDMSIPSDLLPSDLGR